MAFETLNRLRWTGKMEECEVVIVHRGAPGDRKVIPGRDISGIKRGHFYCFRDNRETFIPMHRVLEVRAGGKTIWKRKAAKG